MTFGTSSVISRIHCSVFVQSSIASQHSKTSVSFFLTGPTNHPDALTINLTGPTYHPDAGVSRAPYSTLTRHTLLKIDGTRNYVVRTPPESLGPQFCENHLWERQSGVVSDSRCRLPWRARRKIWGFSHLDNSNNAASAPASSPAALAH